METEGGWREIEGGKKLETKLWKWRYTEENLSDVENGKYGNRKWEVKIDAGRDTQVGREWRGRNGRKVKTDEGREGYSGREGRGEEEMGGR